MAYRKLIIDYDKIYNSNNCGPFKIIKDLGKDNRSRRFVRIHFLNTGTELDVRYDIAVSGKVRDELYDIDFNTIYNSYYYGPYKIISYIGRNEESKKIVRVKFLNTGYEYNTLNRLAKLGQVKDYSVDYHDRKLITQTKEEYDQMIYKILESRWKGMMSRCYSKTIDSYQSYGAKGVQVCEYWHNFDNFIQSVPFLMNYNKFYNEPNYYQIDKDYLQQDLPHNKRVYSPETCIFLSLIDNANLAIKENHYKNNNSFYGIRYLPDNKYEVVFSIDNHKISFGVYNNLIAALNEYNFYYIAAGRFELVPLLNENIEHMTHSEAQKYLVSITTNTK